MTLYLLLAYLTFPFVVTTPLLDLTPCTLLIKTLYYKFEPLLSSTYFASRIIPHAWNDATRREVAVTLDGYNVMVHMCKRTSVKAKRDV